MLDAFLVGLIAGVIGTGLGGIVAFLFGKNANSNSALLSFTAGIMLAVVCFELLPESINTIGVLKASIFVMAGTLIMNIFENIFCAKKGKNSLFIIALAIALHNFPEGLVLGVGGQIFCATSLLIGLHNVPEGMAVALPYIQEGKKGKGILQSFLAGVPTVIGALCGGLFSSVSLALSGICLALAGGAMVYVVFSELIPRSNDLLKDKTSGIILTIGIIVGLIVIYLV